MTATRLFSPLAIRLVTPRCGSARPRLVFPRVHYFSSSMAMGAPVILCGRSEAIGSTVIATLKPELDVIHFVMTPESGKLHIPAILRGETPSAADSELGSKDYSQTPVAVILGAGYNDAQVKMLMDSSAGIHPIPWLRPDTSIPAPPPGPDYGKALVGRIKQKLASMEKEGTMREEKVIWY